MRITILNQFYKPDIPPTASLAASLAEDRVQRGDDVTIVASRGGYDSPTQAQAEKRKQDNPRVIRVWTPMLGKKSIIRRCLDYLAYYVLGFVRLLTLPRQDVIITLTTPPYIAWAALAHRLLHRKCKILMWNMDCYPELAEQGGAMTKGGFMSRSMRWANGKLFSRIDHLVCLDQAMADLIAPYHAKRDAGDKPLPVTVIPNWEKLVDYPADADPGEWAGAEELDLGDDFVVLYMGNMGVGHGFDTALDAAEQLKDQPVTFLFIGGGKRYSEVAEAAQSRGLTNVKVRPYVPWEEVPQAMKRGSCALITLRDEILGIMSPSKLHANLAASLPVLYIGPETCNVDEAIARFDCGLSARHGETERVTAFIQGLLDQPDQLKSLQAKARGAFDQAYNDTKVLPQFDQVISELCGTPAPQD